jgi:hypothetical protein
MRFSGTITAVVGAMLVGATVANFPSPSPNGPSPDGPSPDGPGPELFSLEKRSSLGPGPSPGHSFSGPGPKVVASGLSSGPSSPNSDHTLEVRSDASSPSSPSPAGPGPKGFSPGPGPSPDSDHTLEVRSDASSPSPNGPASENHPHPHLHPHPDGSDDHPLEVRSVAMSPSPAGPASENNPNPHSSDSEHQLFARDNKDNGGRSLLVPFDQQPHEYQKFVRSKKPIDEHSPYQIGTYGQEYDTQEKVWHAQVIRQRDFDYAVINQQKEGLARIAEWEKLSQQERDLKDLTTAKEVIERSSAATVKKTEEKMALLELDMEAAKVAKAKERAELDDKVVKADDMNAAKSAKKSGDLPAATTTKLAKRSGPVETPAAPPVDEEKAKVEAERALADKLAADKASADNLKKEAEAKLAAEKEEAKKAEQAAADKLATEKDAAKVEKQKIDDKLAEQKNDDKTDPEKLSAAKIEKQKADEKLAEEKTAAEEAKKAAEAQLAAQKKETKKEEKDAATKLKEEKEAAEKEEKAEKLKGHFDPSKHGVERIAKPKSCSCFEVFSHVLGYETKTSGPLDKFRLDFWALRNRKCIQYCTHPFSKSEFNSYRDTVEGKVAMLEKLPKLLSTAAGMSSGSHEKREEHATPHGAVTTAEEFRRLRADIDEVRAVQANITAATAPKDVVPDDTDISKPHEVSVTHAWTAKLLAKGMPTLFKIKGDNGKDGKDGKKITDPKAAYNELHAAYNLWLVEFKTSLKKQRDAVKDDPEALAQLDKQAVKKLEDAENHFIKASEEAAAAVVVDMREEAFKGPTDKAKADVKGGAYKAVLGKAKSAGAASDVVDGVAAAGKAPVHLENAGTGIIPPA